mmetsp:Transcript_12144/g.36081  ORF Transcript_12144/g.36081 Transcript_12144/m.36081 type:complete len:273 (-) Transcript_12144:24-842(-)
MARLTPIALLVLSLADAVVVPYTSQETGRTLTLCACAKCGSTTVATGFFYAVTGTRHPRGYWRTEPISDVRKWHTYRNCTTAACSRGISRHGPPPEKPGDLAIWVTRDPIERYISSFHSKITCKGEKGDGGARVPGYQDRADHVAPGLQRLAGLKEQHPCLYWSEYVDVLTRIKKLGRQQSVNIHVKPQHLSCKIIIERTNVVTLDTAQLGVFLHGLGGFGPVPGRYPVHERDHGTPRKQHTSRLDLCELVRPEYRALGQPFPAECENHTRQ